jgi:hypothetical protein
MACRPESALQEEASSPLTSPERLAELVLENPMLCAKIARNPGCSQALLDALSIEHPSEVLENPALSLRTLEKGSRYSLFPLKSLISLSLVCDPCDHADLILELMNRVTEGLNTLLQQDRASIECIWLCRGSHVLAPSDCGDRIKDPINTRATFKAYIEGDGPVVVNAPCLTSPELKTGEKRELLEEFLSDLEKGNLSKYIDDYELIREHSGDGEFFVEIDELPEGFWLESNTLYRALGDEDGETCGELLVSFGHCFGGGNAFFENDYLLIPCEMEDETDLEFTIPMGELDSLISLSAAHPFPPSWPRLVANLLYPGVAG